LISKNSPKNINLILAR